MKKTNVAYRTEMPGGWSTVMVPFIISFAASVTTVMIQLFSNSIVPLALALVASVGIACGLYLYWRLRPARAELSVITTEEMHPERKKGLIVLVGAGGPKGDPMQQAARHAIEFHRLDEKGNPVLRVCWMITSTGRDGGVPVALKFRDEFQAKGIRVIICTVDNAFCMKETLDLVKNIYKVQAPSEGLTASDIVADFTGATKPMSAGMILACGATLPMQYVWGDRQRIASEPVAMRLTPGDR